MNHSLSPVIISSTATRQPSASRTNWDNNNGPDNASEHYLRFKVGRLVTGRPFPSFRRGCSLQPFITNFSSHSATDRQKPLFCIRETKQLTRSFVMDLKLRPRRPDDYQGQCKIFQKCQKCGNDRWRRLIPVT